jgi:CDP-diacylglycerol--glycerol-3-phosphate 3-phosphatidyltransferase
LLKQLPNALTLTRLILAPVIAWLWWMAAFNSELVDVAGDPEDYIGFLNRRVEDFALYSTLAAILFIIAALTDLFDGMAARAFNAQSKFGRIIDPIADKAIVGFPLIAIVLAMWTFKNIFPFVPVVTLAVAVIVLRDVTITLVRLSAADGEGARVSSLAKIKTALELVVVGAFLVAAAIMARLPPPADADGYITTVHVTGTLQLIWVALLVFTAALSAYTAWRYLAPAKKPAT